VAPGRHAAPCGGLVSHRQGHYHPGQDKIFSVSKAVPAAQYIQFPKTDPLGVIRESSPPIPAAPGGVPGRAGAPGYYPLLVCGVVLGGIALVALISLTTPPQFGVAASLLAGGIVVVRVLRARGRMVTLLVPTLLVLAGAAIFAAYLLYFLGDGVGVLGAGVTFLGAFDLLLRAWETGLPASSRGSWWEAMKVLGLMFAIATVALLAWRVVPAGIIGYPGLPMDPAAYKSATTAQSPMQLHEWMVTDTLAALGPGLGAKPCIEAIHGTFEHTYAVVELPRAPGNPYAFDLGTARGARVECALRPIEGAAVERRLTYSFPRGISVDSLAGVNTGLRRRSDPLPYTQSPVLHHVPR